MRIVLIFAISVLSIGVCMSQNVSYGLGTANKTFTGTGLNVPHGSNNVMIGKRAGMYITNEKYCIIVGHDSIHINTYGKDMIWLVDWNETALNAKIKKILLSYYNDYVLTKKDNEYNRKKVIDKIYKTNLN